MLRNIRGDLCGSAAGRRSEVRMSSGKACFMAAILKLIRKPLDKNVNMVKVFLWVRPMATLPEFNPDGMLPPGDHVLNFDELAQSMLVTGPASKGQGWNCGWRAFLVQNLAILVRQLWQVGVTEIFVDGSFAEDKERPNDIDGYFVCDRKRVFSGELQRELNLLDPHKIWTWDPASRKPFRGYPKKQLPMWHQYRVELYPHYGQSSGLTDQHGNQLEFPSAFRISRRNGQLRGIVKIGV